MGKIVPIFLNSSCCNLTLISVFRVFDFPFTTLDFYLMKMSFLWSNFLIRDGWNLIFPFDKHSPNYLYRFSLNGFSKYISD